MTIRKGEPYQPQVLRKQVRATARRVGIERLAVSVSSFVGY
jgi:hypothetical protein